MKVMTSIIHFSALLVGCASSAPAPQEEVQENLAKSIDCSTAAADIQTLTGEKASTSQEIKAGASSIIPVGAVAHMFGGSEKESFAVGTGEYNKKLDTKIAEIKQQCNLN